VAMKGEKKVRAIVGRWHKWALTEVTQMQTADLINMANYLKSRDQCNVWWAVYRAKPMLLEMVNDELHIRVQAKNAKSIKSAKVSQ
jgi:hypothetical protein